MSTRIIFKRHIDRFLVKVQNLFRARWFFFLVTFLDDEITVFFFL